MRWFYIPAFLLLACISFGVIRWVYFIWWLSVGGGYFIWWSRHSGFHRLDGWGRLLGLRCSGVGRLFSAFSVIDLQRARATTACSLPTSHELQRKRDTKRMKAWWSRPLPTTTLLWLVWWICPHRPARASTTERESKTWKPCNWVKTLWAGFF